MLECILLSLIYFYSSKFLEHYGNYLNKTENKNYYLTISNTLFKKNNNIRAGIPNYVLFLLQQLLSNNVPINMNISNLTEEKINKAVKNIPILLISISSFLLIILLYKINLIFVALQPEASIGYIIFASIAVILAIIYIGLLITIIVKVCRYIPVLYKLYKIDKLAWR